MKTTFNRGATDMQRSYGRRRRYHGKTVRVTGEPVSNFRPSGGNPPHGKHGAPIHTSQNRSYWEQDGKRTTPPPNQVRGWK